MTYARPQKLDDALSLLATRNWSVVSGGTDFYPALRDRPASGNVLDIGHIEELRSISRSENYWRIGALVTWTEIFNTDLPPAFDGLKAAAGEIGSIQIQNRATVTGNICNASPAADGVPPLLVLNAQVELKSKQGTRQLALEDFILGNRKTAMDANEMVSAILVPKAAVQGRSTFLKLGSRRYLVISISMVAIRLGCDDQNNICDAAVSVGSCSLVARRITALEDILIGKPLSSDLPQYVLADQLDVLTPVDDIRADKSYRIEATLELLRRALTSLAGELA